jgi:FkbM family methyltransferase
MRDVDGLPIEQRLPTPWSIDWRHWQPAISSSGWKNSPECSALARGRIFCTDFWRTAIMNLTSLIFSNHIWFPTATCWTLAPISVFFTVLAAKNLTTGRVLAAEPSSAAFARLSGNVVANDTSDRVILYNGLVAHEDSTATFNIVDGREEYSSMGDVVHPSVVGEKVHVETLPTMTLDTLVAEHALRPALIKVDVEGAEGMVFSGAEETLRKYRPVILSEFSRPLLEKSGSSPETIMKMFDRYGYDVHNPFNVGAKVGDVDFDEIIAIPRPQ